MSDDLADRMAALERRVEQLEGSRAAEGNRAAPPYESEVFWALEGLKERVPGGGVLFTGSIPLPTGETYEWQHGVPAGQLVDVDWSEIAAELAATLGALGHPVRLRLLGLVLTGTRSVAELREDADLGTSGQLYHHLRQLVSAGWLRATTRGHYTVPAERVVPLLVIFAAARR